MKSTFFLRAAVVILAIGMTHVPQAQASQEEDIRQLFGKLDANGDRRLSEHEFVGEKNGAARAKARKRFRMLDQNGDRWLSLKELKRK